MIAIVGPNEAGKTCFPGQHPDGGRRDAEYLSRLVRVEADELCQSDRRTLARPPAQVLGIEPQRGDAFTISLDGYDLRLSALSKADLKKMSAYFSMGMFSAGMEGAGKVGGIPLSGNRSTGHWEWAAGGHTVEVFGPNTTDLKRHAPRWVIAALVRASAH